jgi:hypothetical protein
VKRESSRILLVVFTTVIMVAVFAPCAHTCIDAKFTWDPYNYPPVFSVGDTVTFNASISTCNWNSTSEEDIPLVSYEWDFGDESTGEGETVTHSYTEKGTFDVTLTITDAEGDNDTMTIPFTVESSSPSDENLDGFPWWVAVVVVAAGVGIALPVYFIKMRKTKE